MSMVKQIPKDLSWDNRIQLMLEGYLFVQNRCNRLDTDVFQTKLNGKNVICMNGKEAAEIFFDEEKFEPLNNIPQLPNKNTNEKMTINSLDDQMCEQLCNELLSSTRISELNSLYFTRLEEQAKYWSNQEQIIVFDEIKKLITRVACHWAGIPIKDEELSERANDLYALVDPFESAGLKQRDNKRIQNRVESWIQEVFVQVWKEEIHPEPNATITQISNFQQNEKLLSVTLATNLLIQILKMIVLNANFITFEVLATIQHQEYKRKLYDIDQYDDWFIQEVRRYFPFEPFIGAKVRKEFTWEGYRFAEGSLVLLDMYGTNHDPRIWYNPDLFWPERFKDSEMLPYVRKNHNAYWKMLSEKVSRELMKTTLYFLTNHINFEVVDQDFDFSLRKIPTMLKTGLILKNIKTVQ